MTRHIELNKIKYETWISLTLLKAACCLSEQIHVQLIDNMQGTVGAGLPVISTLNDLMNTGDEMVHIEGILSGTLSFIFNSFGAGRTFSQVVADAKAKGFTEPDPREDLAGIPAAMSTQC